MARSTAGVRSVTSVALLSAGFVSVKSTGATTVAPLLSTPVASGEIVAAMRKESVPPAAMSRDWATSPLPDACVHVDPGVALHVQVAPINVSGRLSATTAPSAGDGPELVIVTT